MACGGDDPNPNHGKVSAKLYGLFGFVDGFGLLVPTLRWR